MEWTADLVVVVSRLVIWVCVAVRVGWLVGGGSVPHGEGGW
jgi:hypothetical protein